VSANKAVGRQRRTGHSRGHARQGWRTGRYTYYQTQDKYILFRPEEKQFWLRFCDAIGRPDLASRHDDSVVTDFGNDADLLDELQNVFHTRTQTDRVELSATTMSPEHLRWRYTS
jgi:crotonobetainyl-CoA:carnitine CoA-transferase CaiB-like acyl-CoA transferase